MSTAEKYACHPSAVLAFVITPSPVGVFDLPDIFFQDLLRLEGQVPLVGGKVNLKFM